MSERQTAARPRGPMGHRGPGVPGEKAKDFKGTVKKLFSHMGRFKLQLALVGIFAMCSTIFNIVGPKVLSQATTEIFTGLVSKVQGSGGIDFGKIGQILLMLIILYLISAGFSLLQGWIMSGVTQKTCYGLRRDISEKIHRMPMKYFESRTVGEVLSRITNDVDTLGQSLNQSVTTLITSVTTLIGVLVMMLTISPLMTLIALVILPVSAGLVMLVVKHSQKYFVAQQKYLGKINGQVEETYSGHSVVRAFNREEEVVREFDQTNAVLFKSAWLSQFLSGMMQPIMTFVGNLGYVAVAIVGSIFAAAGAITIGDIQAFIQYVKNFTQPITQVSQQVNFVVTAAAGAQRVFELMDQKPEEDEGYVELVNAKEGADGQLSESTERTNVWAWRHPHKADGTITYTKLEGSVVFDDVDFGYTPDKIVLHNISLWAEPGQKIAFVGATGAGKTTITNLINRFYDIADGKIRYDGININKIKKADLRRSLGIVLQDTHLFTGTVMDNIRYGNLDATDEECIAAAQLANADGFIRRLPDGYDTMLTGDGANLSQGQRQLLAIARAAVADPPVLILDEATSSIDTRTEKLVQDGMDALMCGRTTFVIAHRLSTVRNSDCIMVMDQGRIIERGTHDQLIEKKGKYYQLYTGNLAEEAG